MADQPRPAGNLRLGTDIGGTFTDVAAFDEETGRLLLGKSLTTPAHLVQRHLCRRLEGRRGV